MKGPTVYTASKTKHADKWRAWRAAGVNVNSTWIDEAGPNESADLPDLWRRCIREARHADLLVLYCEPGEVLKGALVEVGAALASGVPVLVVGTPDGSWTHYNSVQRCESLNEALAVIRGM